MAFRVFAHLLKAGGIREPDIQGKKDAYYDAKNNEFVDWRKLFFLHAKRFRYLMAQNVGTAIKGTRAMIFDDTPIEKTGKKTVKLSPAYDHVSGRHIFGFKLLVCGFWDGGSFIPLDFSFHREKGAKNEELIKTFKKAKALLEKAIPSLKKYSATVSKKEQMLVIIIACYFAHLMMAYFLPKRFCGNIAPVIGNEKNLLRFVDINFYFKASVRLTPRPFSTSPAQSGSSG